MKRSEQMRLIEERIAKVKDQGYEALQTVINRGPSLQKLEKVAVLLEEDAKSYLKGADKVEEFTKANAEYWLSSAGMYAVKNYAFEYGKMFAPQIAIAVAAVIAFQLITNPDSVIGTVGSICNGITSTIGNYTGKVTGFFTTKSAPVANIIDVNKNGTLLDTPINKNITETATAASIPKQDSLDKYVDMSVKVNISQPTYIEHDGLHYLVTPVPMNEHHV